MQTNQHVYVHMCLQAHVYKGTDYNLEKILGGFIYKWALHILIYETVELLIKYIINCLPLFSLAN